MNVFDQMRQAMAEAERQMRAADNQADAMADLLEGRLRKCSAWKLKRLKRELQEFNAQTGRWKS